MKKKIIILGGSFNPIHIAHIKYAMLLSKHADEVWLMPTKNHAFRKELIDFNHRFKMVQLACKGKNKLVPSNFELNLASNKTYDILTKLQEEYDYSFQFAVGLDCANEIQSKWYKGQELINNFSFFVVARPGSFYEKDAWFLKDPHVFIETPIAKFNISSSEIRNNLNKKLLNEIVYDYIIRNNLYV